MTRRPCLHCRRYRAIYCRGLCRGCFRNPTVRDQYQRLRETGVKAAPMNARCTNPNCGKLLSSVRPRGLCYQCYADPAIRSATPTVNHRCVRAGLGLVGSTDLPKRPTRAQPGKPDKIALMRERARRGVCLFHPGDAVRDDEVRA